MRLFNFLSLLAGLASAVTVPELDLDIPETSLESRQGCPEVQIVACGGEGTVVGDLGYLNTTIAAIQAAVPGAQLFQIGYPVGASSPVAIASGVPQLQSHVHSMVAQCPKTKMILVGYSAGGAIVMDTLCGAVADGSNPLPTRYRHHIIANIVYGDPTFIPGLRYDVGTCTQTGEVPRAYPGQCFPFGRKTKSYCTANDQVCCSGTDVAVHFTYPGQYDADAAKWCKAKYTYYRRHS